MPVSSKEFLDIQANIECGFTLKCVRDMITTYREIIWMFCLKQDYLKIEKIQYKALQIVYNSNELYEELLLRNNEVSVHQKQLGILATEVFKSLADINPNFIKSHF